MFRVPTLLLLITLLIAPISFSGPTPYTPERTLRSVVKVFVDAGEESMACSGFIVSVARGEVMTVAHCVKPQGPLTVDGQTAELIRKDEAFALLKIEPFSGKPALEISEGEVSIAQSVAASGWAYGEILVYIPRAVIGKDKGDFAMNGVIVPGMSGGPVVDASGLVVGINQASTDALGIACGAREIRDFLKGR